MTALRTARRRDLVEVIFPRIARQCSMFDLWEILVYAERKAKARAKRRRAAR